MSTEWTFEVGMEVVDVDGQKVGGVAHLAPDHIVVSKGWLFPTDYLVPMSDIAIVDDKVHLSISKEAALARGTEPVAGRGSAQKVLEHVDDTPVNVSDQ